MVSPREPLAMTKILVVDDEFLVSDMLAFLLEDEGYEVERAYHGKMALDLLDKNGFELVITDFMMPLMTGLELAQALKAQERYSDVPIILVSGAQGSIARAHRELFAAVFDKPFRNDALLQKIEDLLGPAN